MSDFTPPNSLMVLCQSYFNNSPDQISYDLRLLSVDFKTIVDDAGVASAKEFLIKVIQSTLSEEDVQKIWTSCGAELVVIHPDGLRGFFKELIQFL